ncbi:hypothetical protein J5X98_24340 [Leptothermofonsia sichuanensis E412]|nr:hypothetical protein [Leptothermofonsia sichuanensis]QZZ20350.1 hypothetical protein J5X98_24340 [Leptothermofonsia sichuanensis E412]
MDSWLRSVCGIWSAEYGMCGRIGLSLGFLADWGEVTTVSVPSIMLNPDA